MGVIRQQFVIRPTTHTLLVSCSNANQFRPLPPDGEARLFPRWTDNPEADCSSTGSSSVDFHRK